MGSQSPRLGDIGEEVAVKSVLELIRGKWGCPSLEPGDDAVCVSPSLENIVWKIDGYSLYSSMLPWNTLRDIGWKAVAGVASDLVAKAATPITFLLSVGLEPSRSLSSLADLVKGALEAAVAHGGWIGGGDTNSARPGGEWIDIAGIGVARRKPIPLFCPTRRGYVYVTTGRIGLTGIAFHAAYRGWIELVVEEYPRVVEATSRPLARTLFPSFAASLGECILCSSDVSDGLAYTLYRLAESGELDIELEDIPVEREALEYSTRTGARVEDLAFYGGEEYEVVFIADPNCGDRVENEARKNNIEIRFIGEAKPGNPRVAYRGRLLERKRWDQFKETWA